MKRCPQLRSLYLPLLALSWAMTWATAAAESKDGGGRDVSVALFSTHAVQRVTLTPLGPNTWRSRCARCAHETLTQPLTLADPTKPFAGQAELFAGGTLRVTDDASHESRTATGLWHLRASKTTRSVDVILTLPSERYVAAVLNAEAARNEPPQSLLALAVVARTYALNGRHYTAPSGHLGADLCDSTQCQAMLLQPPSKAIEGAARSTAGETLWFGPRRAEVYFSQSCGGITEQAGALWPALRGLPYLQSHPDPFCMRRVSSAWHAQIAVNTFLSIAKAEGWRLPEGLVSVQIAQRSRSHRALRVVFTGRDGAQWAIAASALRLGIGRALGWNQVRSDSYELGLRNGALLFDGHGHGHGVGLCQIGAAEMAAEGKSARDILAFYFPGTAVRIAAGDQGWLETHIGPLTVRSTQPISSSHQAALAQLWTEAQRRFPPAKPLAPMIVFAPTTELFRQLAAQPGWALASTQDNTVVLQPAAVFNKENREDNSTLLHEMLHVAVESNCNDRTPLWLREGLVEALAGERTGAGGQLSTQAIEAALRYSDTLQSSERAHLAAAAKVQALLARYGLATVRVWLLSGVPASAS